MHGRVPYQDYWWVYGPLVPYDYASFLKVFGVSIVSILAGNTLLQILTGLLLYLDLYSIIHPAFAYLAASWFLIFFEGFFFTHNHTGGILLVVGCAYCLLHYVREDKSRYLWWGIRAVLR
jgi:hypothetical protein